MDWLQNVDAIYTERRMQWPKCWVYSTVLCREKLTAPMNHTWWSALFFAQQLLDYESCSSYTFSVEVDNPIVDAQFLSKGPFKDQATVRVMVLNADEPPQFSLSRYHLDVSENCPPVCSVGGVSAVDPDTGQSSNIRWLLHHRPLIIRSLTRSAGHSIFPRCFRSWLSVTQVLHRSPVRPWGSVPHCLWHRLHQHGDGTGPRGRAVA